MTLAKHDVAAAWFNTLIVDGNLYNHAATQLHWGERP